MARRLEGNIGMYGGGRNQLEGDVEGTEPREFYPRPQYKKLKSWRMRQARSQNTWAVRYP
jgi:hypothetical protein